MEEVNKGIGVVKTLKQVMHSIKQRMEHEFKDMRLTGPQGMTIGALTRHGKMKVSDLSEELGLSNSTVSGIIDRLEKQGLVERIRSEEDRRVVYVSVTPESKKQAEEHFKCLEKKLESMMNHATPQELDKILDGLATLVDVLERQKKEEESKI